MKLSMGLTLMAAALVWGQTGIAVNGGSGKSPRGALQSGGMEMPVLGFAVCADPLEVRVVEGVPGAANLSEPLELPEGTRRVLAAPGQRWLLVDRGAGTPLAWIPGQTQVELPGLEGGWDLAAISPSGQELALYRAEGRKLAVYRGLPTRPELARAGEMAGWPDDLESLALADGAAALGGRSGAGRAVWLDAEKGTALPLLESERVGEVAFLRGESRLAAIDAARQRIVILGDPSAGGETRTVLGPGDGLQAPERLVSRESRVLQVGEANQVWTVTLEGGLPARETVPARNRLEPMALRHLWLLKADAGEPAWLWFPAVGEQRVTFVTAGSPREE
jgi:hypothetical protein